MPRPSTTIDTTETSIPHELPQRMNSTPNSSFVHSNDHLNSNGSLLSSPDYPSRLQSQLSLPDETSSSSIPILRHNSSQFDDILTSTTPTTTRHPSPIASPIPTFQSISILKPLTEDKSIQCLEQNSNDSTNYKRKEIEDEKTSWIQLATK